MHKQPAMIETTSDEERAASTRRIFYSADAFNEFEIAVTLRQDRALPDECVDLRVTGAVPENGAVADALLAVAAALNRHRGAPALIQP